MNNNIDSITLINDNININYKNILYLFIKRIIDIIFSIIGIIVLIPLTIIVKICSIFTKDFHSIFYTQDRIGQNGEIFKLYKFRSMVPNADEELKKLLRKPKYKKEWKKYQKLRRDPRITRIGKFLRRTSLDELPQMINILKGDMSLIGNRPYLPREQNDMRESYYDIIKTRPGLTGLWQVSGRSYTTFKKRLELESFYSNNFSIKLDIKILFKTINVVLKNKGAK